MTVRCEGCANTISGSVHYVLVTDADKMLGEWRFNHRWYCWTCWSSKVRYHDEPTISDVLRQSELIP